MDTHESGTSAGAPHDPGAPLTDRRSRGRWAEIFKLSIAAVLCGWAGLALASQGGADRMTLAMVFGSAIPGPLALYRAYGAREVVPSLVTAALGVAPAALWLLVGLERLRPTFSDLLTL